MRSVKEECTSSRIRPSDEAYPVNDPVGALRSSPYVSSGLPDGGLDLLPPISLGSGSLGFPESTFAPDSPFDLGLDFLASEQQGRSSGSGRNPTAAGQVAAPPAWLMAAQTHGLGLLSSPSPDQGTQLREGEAGGAGMAQPQRSSSNDNAPDLHSGDHETGHERLAVKHTRRAEQNRRAQAKFRQRKKDKVSDMEKQLAALNMQMERLMEEKEAYAEKAFRLQQTVEQRDAQLATMKGESKGVMASDELVSAFWEMVVELKRVDGGLAYTREGVQDMIFGMLNWRSLDLGFIRREIVAQLLECCKQGGEVEHSPANRQLHRLVTAYNKMVHKCGENNPLAFRTFLSLQLPEQQGRRADAAFWRAVVESGNLTVWQKKQLTGAYQQLLEKMRGLMERRDGAGLIAAPAAGGALHSMDQAKEVLDLHEHILKEEQAAVFNFRTSFSLAVEPVQQAKLMISSFPFSLDTLAVCTVIAADEQQQQGPPENLPFLSQLPTNSPFQALAPRLQRS